MPISLVQGIQRSSITSKAAAMGGTDHSSSACPQ